MEVTEAYVKGFKRMQIQRIGASAGAKNAREKTVYQMFKGGVSDRRSEHSDRGRIL